MFAFLNEAALCLQEGILRSARDGDVGAIFGLGFPPFLGGPFRYLDHLGPRFAAEVLERLAARHGPRFAPAAILKERGREGRSFHPPPPPTRWRRRRRRSGRDGEGGRDGTMKEAAIPKGEPPILQIPPEPTEAVVVGRFGDIVGKRFTRDNMALLGQAHAAYVGPAEVGGGHPRPRREHLHPVVGRPRRAGERGAAGGDPARAGRPRRAHPDRLARPSPEPQPGREVRDRPAPSQPRAHRRAGCTARWTRRRRWACRTPGRVEPVREYFFVADHHADPDEVEADCRAQGVRSVKLAYVGLPVGSTSTFMAVIAAAFGVLESVGPEGRAAAALGIYTDTSALLHGDHAPGLPDVRAADPRRGHRGAAGRPARLPRAAGVVRATAPRPSRTWSDAAACASRPSATCATSTAT